MAVDQAGQQPQAFGVDLGRVLRDLKLGPGTARGDVIVLDEYHRVAHDVPGRRLEQRVAKDRDRCHAV